MENWKDVVGYEGIYKVSSCGQIKSCGALRGSVKDKKLKPIMDDKGYCQVSLYKEEKKKNLKIHHIVTASFIGDRGNFVVNHKNGIKTDNRLENLEYCTARENAIHAFNTGLTKIPVNIFPPTAKLTESDVIKIRKMYSDGVMSRVNLAKIHNVTKESIYNVINNKTWKNVK
jgi:hypothetical protein